MRTGLRTIFLGDTLCPLDPGGHCFSLLALTVVKRSEASLTLYSYFSSQIPEYFSSFLKFLNKSECIYTLIAIILNQLIQVYGMPFLPENSILLYFKVTFLYSEYFSVPFVRVSISKSSKDRLCSLLCLSVPL